MLIDKPDNESGDLLYDGNPFLTCHRSRGTRVGWSSWLHEIIYGWDTCLNQYR